MKKEVQKELKYQNLPKIFLVISLIILSILILGWVALFVLNQNYETERRGDSYEGSLGSSGIISPDTLLSEISLEILNYSVLNNNQSLNLTIRRGIDSEDLLRIDILFKRLIGECSGSLSSNLPSSSESKVYLLDSSTSNCGESGYSGLYEVIAFPVYTTSINLTQTETIPDIRLNEDNGYQITLDLDNHFAYLGEGDPSLKFSYKVSVPGIISVLEEDLFYTSHKVGFYASSESMGDYYANITLSYPGLENRTSNNFQIFVAETCSDSDGGFNYTFKGRVQNSSDVKVDNCFDELRVREYYCSSGVIKSSLFRCSADGSSYCKEGKCVVNSSANSAPVFDYEACYELAWDKNNEYILDLIKCFDDAEGDSLNYRYVKNKSCVNTDKIDIQRNGDKLKIIPKKDWYGTSCFYIFAGDGEYEKKGTVNIEIKQLYEEETTISIENPLPKEDEIYLFSGFNKTFSISNREYDSVEWYLDGEAVKSDSLSYIATGLDNGNYEIKVIVKKGDESAIRVWNLDIEDEEVAYNPFFTPQRIILYSIVVIIIIIVFLVIWLILSERNKKLIENQPVAGIFDSPKEKLFKSADASRSFNIPGK
jgi:hypothetical protein